MKTLESLLAHSAYGAVDLEPLIVLAYNLKLEQTPFRDSYRLTPPELPRIPFEADRSTIMDADIQSFDDERFPGWRI